MCYPQEHGWSAQDAMSLMIAAANASLLFPEALQGSVVIWRMICHYIGSDVKSHSGSPKYLNNL